MSTATKEVTTTEQPTTVRVEHGQFGGKYQHASEEIYLFLTEQYALSTSKSHRIAHAFACDFGAAMKKSISDPAKAKVSATSKDGSVTLREAMSAKAKGVEATPAMQIAHAIQWLGEAGKHGISYGKTDWLFSEQLEKWIADMPE